MNIENKVESAVGPLINHTTRSNTHREDLNRCGPRGGRGGVGVWGSDKGGARGTGLKIIQPRVHLELLPLRVRRSGESGLIFGAITDDVLRGFFIRRHM